MALLDATTANDDSIVVAFSDDDDDDDDESMIFNRRLFRRRCCLFPIERRVRFCAPPPPPRVPRRRKWNGEGESAMPSFDMRARVFGAQRWQRILSPNEEKTTKIFLLRKKKGKRRDVRRRNERHNLYKVTFVCVLK